MHSIRIYVLAHHEWKWSKEKTLSILLYECKDSMFPRFLQWCSCQQPMPLEYYKHNRTQCITILHTRSAGSGLSTMSHRRSASENQCYTNKLYLRLYWVRVQLPTHRSLNIFHSVDSQYLINVSFTLIVLWNMEICTWN